MKSDDSTNKIMRVYMIYSATEFQGNARLCRQCEWHFQLPSGRIIVPFVEFEFVNGK